MLLRGVNLWLISLLLITPAPVLAQAFVKAPPGLIEAAERELRRPPSALKWRTELWAQIHVESAWRPLVSSKWAHNLAQFTYPTWNEISKQTTPSCEDVDIFNVPCAIRAQKVYMRQLYNRYRFSYSERDRWHFAFAAYNGGLGWIMREKRKCEQTPRCDPSRWLGNVRDQCIRAPWACHENTNYPLKIEKKMKLYQ